MQDGDSRQRRVKGLVTICGAFAGLMITLLGSFISAGILVPTLEAQPKLITLPSTWQIHGLLLCSLTCGSRAGIIASAAYLSIGLMHFPIFHSGGGLDYMTTPGFGYLAGLPAAAWLTGKTIQKFKRKGIISLTISAAAGLMILHLFGIINLVCGNIFYSWPEPLKELIFKLTLGPLPSQLALCAGIGMIGVPLRALLLEE